MAKKRAHTPDESYIDFDGNWKESIVEFFPDFVQFFLPQLYPDIDFSVPPEYLDKEFMEIVEFFGLEKRVADKLVKVRLKNGLQRYILIHIEIQSYFERLFAKRMFLMNAYTIGRFEEGIVALVIYTNSKTPRNFNKFEREDYGTRMSFWFNAYKVMAQKEEHLLASDNIFALYTLANQYTNRTRGEDKQAERLALKEKLFALALERHINLEKIGRLLIFVDNIMKLPLDLDLMLFKNLSITYKQDNKMKSLAERSHNLANRFAELTRGKSLDEFVEKAEQEQKRVEQEQKRVEQEQKRVEQAILKLYEQKIYAIPQIADIFGLSIEEIEKIVFG